MSAALTPDLITDPGLWKLYLEVTPDALEVVAYSALHDQSLIHRRIACDPAAGSYEQALSAIVYDNPLLLADFSRVSVLIDTPRYMVVPDVLTDGVASAMAADLWGRSAAVITDSLPTPGVKLLSAPERAVVSFVRRTFPASVPHHPISSLITYFHNKDRMNNASRMYVHLRGDLIDIIYFNERQLKVANTYSVTNVDDMIYYIMLAASDSGFDMHHDELMVCGVAPQRDSLMAGLRKYAAFVMPVVFPSVMYHAGKEALESPFELIVMPLCE